LHDEATGAEEVKTHLDDEPRSVSEFQACPGEVASESPAPRTLVGEDATHRDFGRMCRDDLKTYPDERWMYGGELARRFDVDRK